MLTKVNKGQVIGNVEIVIDGVAVESIDIYSAQTYSQPTLWDNIKEIINS